MRQVPRVPETLLLRPGLSGLVPSSSSCRPELGFQARVGFPLLHQAWRGELGQAPKTCMESSVEGPTPKIRRQQQQVATTTPI